VAEPKTQKTKASVSQFLGAIENERRRRDAKSVASIMQAVTKSKPAMWGPSIVGFGSYSLKYASGRELDWPIVAFSPRKANLVLYVGRGFDDREALLAKLGKHKCAGGCIYLNSLDDVHLPTLETLIKKSVAHTRAKE